MDKAAAREVGGCDASTATDSGAELAVLAALRAVVAAEEEEEGGRDDLAAGDFFGVAAGLAGLGEDFLPFTDLPPLSTAAVAESVALPTRMDSGCGAASAVSSGSCC